MKNYLRSFNGGLIGREFWGRIDDPKYQTGLAEAENVICLPQGNVVNRTGTQYIATVKDSSKKVRIIEFDYDEGQNLIIEIGAGYFRWHNKNGTLGYTTPSAWSSAISYAVGSLVSRSGLNYYCITANTNQQPPNALYWYQMPAGIYEIPNPYSEADLFQIRKVQSNDIITLTHKNYPPKELRRYGVTDWRLLDINFTPTTVAPNGITATAVGTGAGGNITYTYKVTALDAQGKNESYPSAPASCVGDISKVDHYNRITWTAVAGASLYNVYKESNGLYGYIGQASITSFKDDNIASDLGISPPNSSNPFTTAGNYPTAVGYFEQRKCFASTINRPNTVWMTKTFTENNLSYSLPARDDDRIELALFFDKKFNVQHIVNLDSLFLLSNKSELLISYNGDSLSPATVFSRRKSQIGASYVEPIVVESNIIFCSERGGHVRSISAVGFDQKYELNDLSLRAHEKFDSVEIVDSTYQKAPEPIVWFVRDDGKLFGLTTIPEQQVIAWHEHSTDGLFESTATIPEGEEDSVYFVIKRTINGQDKRYIEKLAPRSWENIEDSVYIDCAVTYNSVPTTTITGLSHLEGKTVSCLADGAVVPPLVVSSGQITLPSPASIVHVGIPYQSTIRTLPFFSANVEGFGKASKKKITKAVLFLYKSRSIMAGNSLNNLSEYKPRSTEDYGSPPSEVNGEIDVNLPSSWTKEGQIYIVQKDPLPINILGITLEVDNA
jgi:hypothetical protein